MSLYAGAAVRDISPTQPMQLCGYPHVRRISTGIHDPLLASALYLRDGTAGVLLCALDLLMLNSGFARRLRRQVAGAAGVPETGVLISCTHTHSAPSTANYLPFRGDPAMPPADPDYLEFCAVRITEAAVEARNRAQPAELAWTTADARGMGGNRHAPDGPSDPEVGVLALRAAGKLLAVTLIYSMHPTVLHEDSTLVSADFPGYARRHLQEQLGRDLIVLYHTGPCGNQSPRYFVSVQTFAEAERLGRRLGAAVLGRLDGLDFSAAPVLAGELARLDLPRRRLPTVAEAQAFLARRQEEYRELKDAGAERAKTRTAEVAVFGAEAVLQLARQQERGEVERVLAAVCPCEVQALRIGEACLAGFPGEMFVEYPLQLKSHAPLKTFAIAYTNGELQGYIVTPEAAAAGGYEAASSLFEPRAGTLMIEAARDMVGRLARGATGAG